MAYHLPVLYQESLDNLNIEENGVYVDATFGGGGHTKGILERLGTKGKVFGFDQDPDAAKNAINDNRFQFVKSNFQYLKNYLKLYAVKQVDGILADLGVSSHQLDQAERGFSYRFEADLDMRMNYESGKSAISVLNGYSVEQLQAVFSKYGEIRNSKTLAQTIETARFGRKIERNEDFVEIIEGCIRGQRNRYLAQVYQALRIEVNDEMKVLSEFLIQATEVLKPGGRLVVISYHSLEDRMVKNYLKTGNEKGVVDKDFYGNIHRPFKIISKKPILPSEIEIKENLRARSAKMRVGEKA